MIRIPPKIVINLALTGSLLLGQASSFAQPAKGSESPVPVQNKPAEPAATTPAKKSDSAPDTGQNRQPDIFVPSEDISEDLSVSFPEDI